ncbi:MAG: hypothetical protein AAB415_02390 [Patescibacteria group bacterium]
MLTIEHAAHLAERYRMPLEDILFIALNVHGVKLDCEFGRIRMDFRLAENDQFRCAKERGELNYFFALPVNPESEFTLSGDILLLGETTIGQAINPMEDVSDLYYFRRKKTVFNFNPNARSACAGCRFCYTSRLTPNDEQLVQTENELKIFFENWMHKYGFTDLSHLVQISVVTGNYRESEILCRFLLELKRVTHGYRFGGKIFYLGSQITAPEQLTQLAEAQPFGVCFSLEVFDRRNLLRRDKKSLELKDAREAMDLARRLGHEVNFSYIVGMEPLQVVEEHFRYFRDHVNKFPTINTFQKHRFQGPTFMDPDADRLEYFLEARQILERLFSETNMRPRSCGRIIGVYGS